MRKVAFLMVAVLWAGVASAQKDPKAKEVLDAMSQKYKNIASYKAQFTNVMENKVEGIHEQINGEIVVKGDKYKLSLGDQVIINNGTTLWTYLKDVNEVNIDTYHPEDGDMSPTNVYNAYKDGYKYRFLDQKSVNGKQANIIELQPESTNTAFNQLMKVVLKIEVSNKTILEWDVYDRSGNVYTYTIKSFNPSINASDSQFEFKESDYPGVEVIDLR